MSKMSKFFADMKSYEADHKATDAANAPRMRGRTALLIIVALLLFLAAFTYVLMQTSMRPQKIEFLESVLFAVAFAAAGLSSWLRYRYSRKR